jgi:hypothetical protein
VTLFYENTISYYTKYRLLDLMSGIEDITTKYDDFIHTIKTRLPKVSPKLVIELLPLLKEEEAPMYNLQVHLKENSNIDEIRNTVWNELKVIPAFYSDGTHAVIEHRITLQILENISKLNAVDNISGSYAGGGRASRGPTLERDVDDKISGTSKY